MKILRGGIWWNSIVPQVLGWGYFCKLLSPQSNFLFTPARLLLFFIALVCTASFGYLLNDFFDRDGDAIAGKQNLLARQKTGVSFALIGVSLLCAFVCWFSLSAGAVANILYVIQIAVLVAYSAPPLRLKTKGVLGVAADAFYAHINPVLIVLFSFGFFQSFTTVRLFFLIPLVLVLLIKGARNILLHQIEDRKNDSKAEVSTFVLQKGALYSVNLINCLLPIEFFVSLLLVLGISYLFPPFVIFALLFLIVTYLKFSGWKLSYLPKRQLKFKFLYVLNDFYEGWVPTAFVVILCTYSYKFLFLLFIHQILFPQFVTKLVEDFRKIAENFRTEEDY